MSEILEVLHQKAKIEAEDAQRILLSALNGLAGLFLLENNILEAVRTYREVISTIEANHEYIKADKLQQLHTFENLVELLEGPGRNAPGIPRTLRDDQLRGKAEEIREEYLAEPLVRLNEAKGEMEESQAAEMKAIEWFQKEAAAAGGGGGLTGNGGRTNTTNSSSSNKLLQNWWVDAISMLTNNTFDKGEGVCKAIQNHLNYTHDEYRLLVQRNATDIGGRFRDLFGLQLLLQQNLKELETHETKALSELNRLARACENPSKQLIQMAASCARCRPEGMSTAGNTCSHCQLDEAFLAWEVRLFEIRTISGGGGNGNGGGGSPSQRAMVSAEEAAAAAHKASLQRVGRGGLNEDAVDHSDGNGNNNNDQQNTVTRTNITRSPSQIEQALRHLSHQLRLLKPPTPNDITHKDLLLKAAKAQLEVFEAKRRQFLKARALSLAQRGKLYALDELEMCNMRLTKIPMYEPRRDGEELFKLYEEEIPVRSTELSGDKVVAKSELQLKLNTLKYLENLRRQKLHGRSGGGGGHHHHNNPASPLKSPSPLKAHTNNNASNNNNAVQNHQEEEEANICPICHDPLGPQLVMLPCGHAQCIKCNNLMVSRLPSAIPAKHKKIACPVCRKQTLVVEIAYVEAGGQQEENDDLVVVNLVANDDNTIAGPDATAIAAVASGSGGATDKQYQQREKGIKVKGSYGTKVSCYNHHIVLHITGILSYHHEI
jgi:E3 ubiquitin-protein ligase SHPRH